MATLSNPVEAELSDFETGRIMTIVGGHFVHDTFSAFISPLLPLLIEKLSLSLTLAGSLTIWMQVPSLLSILIGYLADRISVRYLVIFAPAATATLISVLGFMPSYAAAAVLLFAVGISVMAFHAPAPAMIALISGRQVGKGMSLFMAGGEMGRSVGPLLVGYAVTQWGMDGLWRLMVFGWIASAVLFVRLRNVSAPSKRKAVARKPILGAFGRMFTPLFAVMFFRNFIASAMATYLVVYLVSAKEYDLPVATGMLALYQFAGVGGALSGGTLSDHIGRRRTIAIATMTSAILMLAFLAADGWVLYPLLIILGLTTLSVTPVFQALVQDFLPEHRATASGTFMFAAFIVQAVNTLIIGVLGDFVGLTTALLLMTGLSLLSLPFTLALPAVSKQAA